jgi:hypothetical protein
VTSDFIQHPELAQSILQGQLVLQPFYGGADYVVALVSYCTEISPVVAARVVAFGSEPLLALAIYWCATSVTERREYGLVCAAVFVAAGGLWYNLDVNVGLIDNSLGMVADCLILGSYARLVRTHSPNWFYAFVACCGLGLFTHYTVVTVFPALLVYPAFLEGDERRMGLVIAGVISAAATALLIVDRGAVVSLGSVFFQDSPPISLSTAFSPVLSFAPFFLNLFELMEDDVAMLVLMAAFLILMYRIGRRDPGAKPVLLLALWFVPVFAIGNYDVGLWRYALEGALPFLMLASWPISRLAFPTGKSIRMKERRRRVGVLVAFLVVGSLASPVVGMAQMAGGQTSVVAHDQQEVYASMLWIEANVPRSSVVLSTTDSDYWFLSDVAPGKNLTGDFNSTVVSVPGLSQQKEVPGYLVETTFYPNGAPAITQTYGGQLHVVVGNFTGLEPVIYQHGGVTVYKLGDSG